MNEQHAVFLEKLRRSGKTNMFGATPYLMVEFGLTQTEAQQILVEWMKTYNPNDYLHILFKEVIDNG
jgi:hypothetical protein